MNLVPYSPFLDLQGVDRDFDRLWRSERSMLPSLVGASAMDMYEEKGDLAVEVSLPNFKKEEIKVATDEGVLEISAEHKEKDETKDKRRYYFHESSNRYFRRVVLPEGVKADKIKASFKEGVLKITMPMAAPKRTKAIDVK